MSPVIHFVRHAQGFHNLGAGYTHISDPDLTPLGEQQCSSLREISLAEQPKISLVVASPLSRTLNTAFLAFQPALSNGRCPPRILAIPSAQETSNLHCDIGREPSVLESHCIQRGWPVDLSLVEEGWTKKTAQSKYSPACSAIRSRAKETRCFLRRKLRELVEAGVEDPEIVLVSHGQFLHYLTDDWEDCAKFMGTGWGNCEMRTYFFEDRLDSEDSEARLVESSKSRNGRGLEHPTLSAALQMELFRHAPQKWVDQGAFSPRNAELECALLLDTPAVAAA